MQITSNFREWWEDFNLCLFGTPDIENTSDVLEREGSLQITFVRLIVGEATAVIRRSRVLSILVTTV